MVFWVYFEMVVRSSEVITGCSYHEVGVESAEAILSNSYFEMVVWSSEAITGCSYHEMGVGSG